MRAYGGKGRYIIICNACGRSTPDTGVVGWLREDLKMGGTVLVRYDFCSWGCAERVINFWRRVFLLFKPNLEWARTKPDSEPFERKRI